MDADNKLIKVLENILTIDGRGRPAKAREMLALIKWAKPEELEAALKKIGERKFF